MGRSDGPGPIYDVARRADDCRTTSLGIGDRSVKEPNRNPTGPGQYDILSCFETLDKGCMSFGLGGPNHMNPGPSNNEKELMGRESPGPGKYTENFGENLPQYRYSGRTTFAKGVRPGLKKTLGLGPGAYNPQDIKTIAKSHCVDSSVWSYPAHRFGKPSNR